MHHHIQNCESISLFRAQTQNSLKQQARLLKENFIEKDNKQENSLEFTFDDGLKSHKIAARILEDLGLTGTFYYCAQPLQKNQILNVHLAHIAVSTLETKEKSLILNDLKISSKDQALDDMYYIYRKQKSDNLDKEIKYYVNYICSHESAREILLNSLINNTNFCEEKYFQKIYLSENDIKKMAKSGHKFLPHFVTHTNLTLLSEQQLYTEFQSAISYHSSIFGTTPDTMCVPFGSRNSWNTLCEKVAIINKIRVIVLVDDVANIIKHPSAELEYISRTDCCLLPHYEYC